MAQLSISAAARAVGKDRGTLNRYIKSGKISVEKDAAGSPVIETGELLRVFGELRTDGGRGRAAYPVAEPAASSSMHHAVEATLELLKQQLAASQERETRLLAMLEQEQQSRREFERRFLPPGTGEQDPARPPSQDGAAAKQARAASATVDVTPTAVPLPPERKAEKKGFLARLFGDS